MTRSVLRPIRTRRIVPASTTHQDDDIAPAPRLTPGTCHTLAAIGALWVSFAASASTMPSAGVPATDASAGVR